MSTVGGCRECCCFYVGRKVQVDDYSERVACSGFIVSVKERTRSFVSVVNKVKIKLSNQLSALGSFTLAQ